MEIWNIINSVSTAIGTLVAIIAIIIALRQVSNLKRPKLYAELLVRQGLCRISEDVNSEPQIVTALNIEVINLGMSKVFIDHCGVSFIDQHTKKQTEGFFASGVEYEDFCLEPGEKKYCSIILYDFMKQKNVGIYSKEIGINNKAKIEIYLSNGSVLQYDSKKTYAELIDEIERKQGT